MVDGLRDLLGSEVVQKEAPDPAPWPGRQFRLVVPPRTTGERLVVVMESDPDRLWTLSELLSKMRARGWVNPSVRYQRETLRAAINSVARTNTAVERLGPTTYKYNRALAARGSQLAKEVVES